MSARSKGQIAAGVAVITAIGAALIFKLALRPAGQASAEPSSRAEGSSGAAGGEMTIASFGGAYQASQQNAYFKPFAKGHGVKINEEEYNGEIARIKAMVDAKSVSWDVVDINLMTAIAGCDQGIFETLDWSRIGDRSRWLPGSATDCAVGTIVYSTILAYDTDKLSPGPTVIADLFDLRRFPGKRGLQKDPFVNLEWALIADGVPVDQIYQVLRTPEGVDRAFKKLDLLKNDAVWWEAGAQPPQLLAAGQVVMTSAWNGRIYKAVKEDGKHFAIVWDHQAPDFDFWSIPKGTPRLDLAYKFIAFASDAKVMATQSQWIAYGPPQRDAIQNIAPDVLKDLPTSPVNMKNALVIDAQFWADRGEELRNRFNNWLAQR